MSRIDDENAKTLRPALDVIVGMDVPTADYTGASASGNYAGTNETLNGSPERVILMDLIGDGFQNDGNAEPLSTGVNGFLSSKGTALSLTVTFSNADSNTDDLVIISYEDGVLTKTSYAGSGSTRTITIPASNTTRSRITRAILGNAWWYDNESLVSCKVSLRGVETKLDNPELQMSDIEFVGYEPNDITDKIGSIGTEYPIYYTSGFYGDMAPVRQFYLGEQLQYEDKKLTVHGYDATYKLDGDYAGKYVGNASDNITGGGIRKYFDEISAMVTDAGITHTYDTSGADGHFDAGAPFLLPKISKRQIISQAVNIYRTVMRYFATGPDPADDVDLPIFFGYVDAGIPTMTIGKGNTVKTITDTTKPIVTVEPVISTLSFNRYLVEVGASAAIQTMNASNTQIVETSDPYYAFTSSGATVTKITPYKYKVDPTSASYTINGRRIYLAGDGSGNYLPLTYTNGQSGIKVTLSDVDGPYEGVGYVKGASTYGVPIWDVDHPEALEYLLDRSNLLYTFDFRGDPRLQPRDYIQIDVDGSGTLVPMTIESIDINHENGGTTSTIVARKGLI